jgi:hypothetical protein
MAKPHIDPAIFSSDHISNKKNKPPPKMILATTKPAVIKPVPKKNSKKRKGRKRKCHQKNHSSYVDP